MVACLGHPRSLVSAVPHELMSQPGDVIKIQAIQTSSAFCNLAAPNIDDFFKKIAQADAFHVHRQHGKKQAFN